MAHSIEALQLLDKWTAAKAKADEARLEEMRLRLEVVKLFYPGLVSPEGTKNTEINGDYVLKTVFKKTYTLANGEGETGIVVKNLPAALRDRVVKWKPELSVSEYKKLDPAYRDLVNTVLTIKDATPAVSIEKVKV